MFEGIQEILNLSQNGHYQIACTKYFEVKHGVSPSSTAINHPNQFFEESQKAKGYHNGESNLNGESNHIDESYLDKCKLDSSHSILYLT